MSSTTEDSANDVNKRLTPAQMKLLIQASEDDDESAHQDMYDSAWAAFPKGYLTEEEFVEKFQEKHMYGANASFSPAKQLFELIDRNKSGTVDIFEYCLGWVLLNNGQSSMLLKLLFMLFDTDKDGQLNQDEVVQVLYNFFSLTAHLNKDTKASHSLEEIKSDVSSAFGDKTSVSEEEFADLCKQSTLMSNVCRVVSSSITINMMVGDCGLQ